MLASNLRLVIGHTKSMHSIGLAHAGLVLVALALTQEAPVARCEAKEFDWNELGVSLTNAKASNGPASNLRILVSPQRRMTKNYEFEFTNSSQPSGYGGQSEQTSYVLPSSAGSYLTQSALAPNHSGPSGSQAAAYSALSASLASLKNRLSARGVTLSSSLGDSNSPNGGLYSSSAYGSNLQIDPHQQQQSQQQQQASSLVAPSSIGGPSQGQQAQPTYLSVTGNGQSDSQSASYTVAPGQGVGEPSNKTIVLAIPAKINFLTGSKQQQQQAQQQQAQQVTVIQSTGPTGVVEQQARSEYGPKQPIGVIHQAGVQEAGLTLEQPSIVPGSEQQEHHQYVIVNQSPVSSGNDYHSHSVAASLSPSPVHSGQIYSSANGALYQPISAGGNAYTMKYIPAYQTIQQQQPQQQQQQLVQKVYSVVESPQTQQQSLYEQPSPAQHGEQQLTRYSASSASSSPASYSGCLDTCNSADPRWRKYTVSKYKACCSRSSQYDSSFEQPSMEKVSEASAKYNDDAYYSYLYRKSRARRQRRPKPRYHGRYPIDDEQSGDPSVSSGDSSSSSRPSSAISTGRGLYSYMADGNGSPYMRYYKNGSRQQYQSAQAADSDNLDRDNLESGSKNAKESSRAYRRGRSRDLEASSPVDLSPLAPSGGTDLASDEYEPSQQYGSGGSSSASASGSTGGSMAGYGAGEYSIDAGNRAYSSSSAGDEQEERGNYPNDSADPNDHESSKAMDSDYPASGEPETSAQEDSSPESEPVSPSYKYPNRRRKQQTQNKPSTRGRKLTSPSSSSSSSASSGAQGNKESGGNRYYSKKRQVKSRKLQNEHSTSQTNNGTSIDYEAAQAGESGPYNSNHHDDVEQGGSYSNENQDGNEKEAGKYKSASTSSSSSSFNETAVANLSKTTMHLKEILSLLEKKAQLRANESTIPTSSASSVTSTPAPITTTTSLYSSLFGSASAYGGSLPSDYLTSELTLKSPYRFESPLSSSLSSGLHLPPTPYNPLATESFNPPASSTYPGHNYGLHPAKPLHPSPSMGPHHPRRRRINKNNIRYSDLMLHKPHGFPMSTTSLLHAAAKNRFLSQAYYPTLQHPYLYRGSSPSITNPYPYKNIHKNPYTSLFNGPVSSKLASTAGLYTDDSNRLHGSAGGYDPLAHVASSLRPSSMRMRSKPFVFQPQVLPIYSRHTILTQQLDAKA